MNTLDTSRWLSWVQIALLGTIAGGIVYLNSRILSLEAEVEQLLSAQASVQPAMAAAGREVAPSPQVLQAARPEEAMMAAVRSGGDADPGSEAADVTVIDDHLWSEGGRQAIGNVLEEREDDERERRTERWQKMMDYRTEQAVTSVSDELELSSEQAGQVTDLVNTYMEIRSQRWQQMSDDDSDIAEVEREYEESREQVEQDIIAVVGEDGLEMLQEEIRRGWR